MLAEDTIAAISTPPGEGAISIVRISGPEALDVTERVFRGGRAPSALPSRALHRGEIHDADGRVDECLLALFRAPASYTGEHMAEIHGHGGVLVTARIFEVVLKAGARAAEPGEFTQRAFLNGKMDLTQAEAVMDVIRARTPLALRAAQEQLGGRLGAEIEKIRGLILDIVAHVEAYIDFPDEGIDPHTGQQLLKEMQDVQTRIAALLSTANEGRILREGVRLVLCGAPNAGKSSLLNRLLGFDRAIVSEIPGTTRDTIEEFASLHGLPFRITDTAGLRSTADAVEREGVERARHAIEMADIVVHVIDVTIFDLSPVAENEIVAANKIDLPHESSRLPSSVFGISSLTGKGIDRLVDEIVARARGGMVAQPSLMAINARHQSCLERARRSLGDALRELERNTPPELAASHLHSTLEAVGEIVGVADTEEILGRIFSTFCIGK